MTKILFYFKSKNYKSLKTFLILFLTKLKRFKLTKKFNLTKKSKSFFSILKSPHVNKKAQDQFVFNTYSKSVVVCTTREKKLLCLIKKINLNLFTDVKTKIKIMVNENYNKKMRLKIFNPTNFKLNFYKKLD